MKATKKYAATQRERKVGTTFFAHLLRGRLKLAKMTSKRDKNKAPETIQNIFDSIIKNSLTLQHLITLPRQ